MIYVILVFYEPFGARTATYGTLKVFDNYEKVLNYVNSLDPDMSAVVFEKEDFDEMLVDYLKKIGRWYYEGQTQSAQLD